MRDRMKLIIVSSGRFLPDSSGWFHAVVAAAVVVAVVDERERERERETKLFIHLWLSLKMKKTTAAKHKQQQQQQKPQQQKSVRFVLLIYSQLFAWIASRQPFVSIFDDRSVCVCVCVCVSVCKWIGVKLGLTAPYFNGWFCCCCCGGGGGGGGGGVFTTPFSSFSFFSSWFLGHGADVMGFVGWPVLSPSGGICLAEATTTRILTSPRCRRADPCRIMTESCCSPSAMYIAMSSIDRITKSPSPSAGASVSLTSRWFSNAPLTSPQDA